LNASISGLISLGMPCNDSRVVRLRGVISAAALDTSLSGFRRRCTVTVNVRPKMIAAMDVMIRTLAGICRTFVPIIASRRRALVAICA
jgi:hypothetical protein